MDNEDQATHTPAPWPKPSRKLEPYRDAAYSVAPDYDPGTYEATANATLMSTAPELLDALEGIIDYAERDAQEQVAGANDDEMRREAEDAVATVAKARKAIAKARGA